METTALITKFIFYSSCAPNIPYLVSLILCSIISGRRNNGSMPSHWCAGSGSIARKSLQTLEQLKIVEKDPNGGRRLTSQGRRDLDRIAAQVANVGLPPKK